MAGEDPQLPDIIFKLRRGTSAVWAASNPVLHKGEPGLELDTGKFKIGDGYTLWSDLPYYLHEDDISALVAGMIASTPPGEGVSEQELTDHINSPTPHPVYDDGPSLLLLYQNAKV
jgi:hypothetical protein